MQIQELLCFGAVAGQGNPALVIQHGPADSAARQALATLHQRPASVFLSGDADARTPAAVLDNALPEPVRMPVADYYYPHMRSPLCLHATLAAAHVLFGQQGDATPITLRTAMRGQTLRLTREGERVFIALAPQAPAPIDVDAALAASLLGLPALAPRSPPQVASVGSPKLLIEVADLATLYALQPPLARIVDWGRAHGVNGCYVYCQVGAQDYEGRNFNHLDPALEDGATGVAAGALSALLGHGLRLFQGRARGAACLIETRLDSGMILVGGRVETA